MKVARAAGMKTTIDVLAGAMMTTMIGVRDGVTTMTTGIATAAAGDGTMMSTTTTGAVSARTMTTGAAGATKTTMIETAIAGGATMTTIAGHAGRAPQRLKGSSIGPVLGAC